jgi:hypothetical protein
LPLATLATAVRFLLEQQKRTGDNQAHYKAIDLLAALDLDEETEVRKERIQELSAPLAWEFSSVFHSDAFAYPAAQPDPPARTDANTLAGCIAGAPTSPAAQG